MPENHSGSILSIYENHESSSTMSTCVHVLSIDYDARKYFILSGLTLGVYGLIVDYRMLKVIQQYHDRHPDRYFQSSPGLCKLLFLTIVTCGFYWFHYWSRLSDYLEDYDSKHYPGYGHDFFTSSFTKYWVLDVVLAWTIIGPCIWQYILLRSVSRMEHSL